MAAPHLQIANTTATARFVGRCEPCARPFAIDDPSGGSDNRKVVCPECSAIVFLSRIYGVTTEMVCNSSCRDAIGERCDCACGGANHAGSYLETAPMLSEAIERYRANLARRKDSATKAAKTRAQNKAAAKRAAAETWQAEHPAVWAWIAANRVENYFAMSLAGQIESKGALTVGQIGAVERAIQREVEDAEREARQAEEAANAIPAPTGTQTIEGELVAVRVQPSRFSYGSEVKMLVKALGGDGNPLGWSVWCTKPSSLSDARTGDRLRFVAELSRSERDESFAFGKRPRMTQILSQAETSAA